LALWASLLTFRIAVAWLHQSYGFDYNELNFKSPNNKPKAQGGLGIRNMELINKSSIIQFSWNFVTNINPFLSAIFKAKYCPNTSFWTTNTTGPRSVYWSSILQVKHHLHANTIL
jgi:hypothetical protein